MPEYYMVNFRIDRPSRHDGLPRRSLAFPPRNDKGWFAELEQEIKDLTLYA